MLNELDAGDAIADVAGPLGMPSDDPHCTGRWSSIGGGVGTAIAYPTAVALKEAGNQVIAIVGGRTRGVRHPGGRAAGRVRRGVPHHR